MTGREKEILDLITQNPLITQQELSEHLGITRSSIAVHITNLMKKGYILGKGYVLSDTDYILVIGGANMDIQGFTESKLKLRDSNPGTVKLSLGGVGRNIAENTSKQGIATKLITAVGADTYGKKIVEEGRRSGIDMEHVMVRDTAATSTYVSILDEMGDMQVAISDMAILEELSVDFLRKKEHLIKNAKIVVLDTNLPQAVIDYLIHKYKNVSFFLDPVSTMKARKVKELIGYFDTIKPNKYEAEILADIKIETERNVEEAGQKLLQKGVKRAIISLGKEGVFYASNHESGWLKTPSIPVLNATGAGDAFMSGLVFGTLMNYDLKTTCQYATAASILALQHENTINPELSQLKITRKMEEIFND